MIESLRLALLQHPDMPFVTYMQYALYAPVEGYYSSNLIKLGSQGDFITAPELTPLFGYTLANQCQQVLALLEKPCIFEFGAGSGQLCVDILTQLEAMNSLPEHYWILEVSAFLKQQQQVTITEKIPHLASKVQWLERWPDKPFQGVILANEVLDAMPVHRFLKTADGLLESSIYLDKQNNLCEHFLPCSNPLLINHVNTLLPDLTPPYLSEVNLLLPGWIQQCANMLEKGAQFILDYGFPRKEYYHPERREGTLMCHHQHKAHTDFLLQPGEQDITAHVDFTHVAESAVTAGFTVAGYTNQASFLLGNNILTFLENQVTDEKEQFRRTQAVKQLLHPQEMGELFKVMALTKNCPIPLQGFSFLDKRASL